MPKEHIDVLIVGAGIAGAILARQYCRLGLATGLIDAQAGPGRLTSAHAGAITHPPVGRTASKLHTIALGAFHLVVEDWQDRWQERGVFLQSKPNASFDQVALSEKLQRLGIGPEMGQLISSRTAQDCFGIKRSGVWFPSAGSVNLGRLCEDLVQQSPGLRTIWERTVTRIQKENGIWLAFDQKGDLLERAHTVILANAFGAQDLLSPFGTHLFLKPVRGQLSIFGLAKNSKLIHQLPKTIISGEGYCLPPRYDIQQQCYRWLVGSTYDEQDDYLEPRAISDHHNLQLAKGILAPTELKIDELHPIDQFVGLRCVTKDRLPLIGALPQLENIYVATALGSRGLLWSTLASYVIPALSHSSAFALDRLARFGLGADLLASLSPARFFAGALASNSKPIFPPSPKAR